MPDRMQPESSSGAPPRTRLLLGLVALNIALQLINASLIKFASTHLHKQLLLVGLALAVVLVLALGRLLIWNAMHKRFPVSITYPAMALFFPCLVVLAWVYGEPVSGPQVAGACLVTLGVVLLLRPGAATVAEPPP